MTVTEQLTTGCLLPLIRKSEDNLKAACNCSVPRACFLFLYQFQPKIEDLPAEQKKELKDYVLANFKGSKEWLTDTAKIVYTINNYL